MDALSLQTGHAGCNSKQHDVAMDIFVHCKGFARTGLPLKVPSN